MGRFDIDTDMVIDKVYHTKELHKILEDITIQYINDVVLMSDEELNEDRSEWIKQHGGVEDTDGIEIQYDTSIHTLAIEIEQLRRFKNIIYIKTRGLTESK